MDNPSESKLFAKKNIITFLLLGIMILGIPLGVLFVRNLQNQTQLKSSAAEKGELKFVTGNDADYQKCTGTDCTTSQKNIRIELIAPDGFN